MSTSERSHPGLVVAEMVHPRLQGSIDVRPFVIGGKDSRPVVARVLREALESRDEMLCLRVTLRTERGTLGPWDLTYAWWVEVTNYYERRGCNGMSAAWYALLEWQERETKVSEN